VALTSSSGRVQLDWTEHGGHRVAGPPQQQGLGSLLTQRMVQGQLGGQLSTDWRPDGLVITLVAPQERIGRLVG
jgi:two-component sensor histidine kinase